MTIPSPKSEKGSDTSGQAAVSRGPSKHLSSFVPDGSGNPWGPWQPPEPPCLAHPSGAKLGAPYSAPHFPFPHWLRGRPVEQAAWVRILSPLLTRCGTICLSFPTCKMGDNRIYLFVIMRIK